MKDLKWSSGRGRSRITYFLPGLSLFDFNDDSKVFQFSSQDELLPYERGKRLGSPVHWRFYFAFEKPSYAIDDAQIAEFLRSAGKDWTLAAETLRNLGQKTDLTPGRQMVLFLEQVGDALERASAAEQIGTAEAFAEVMDKLPRVPGAELSNSDPWRRAARLLKKSAGPHFERIVSERASICWLSLVVREQGSALGVLNQSQAHPDRQWLTRHEFDRALGKILLRFRDMGVISIFGQAEPIHILYCWQLLGDLNELRAAIDQATRDDDAVFVKALGAMRIWVMSSAKGLYSSLEGRAVSSFMDAKAAKDRLRTIQEDQRANKELRQLAQDLASSWADDIPQ